MIIPLWELGELYKVQELGTLPIFLIRDAHERVGAVLVTDNLWRNLAIVVVLYGVEQLNSVGHDEDTNMRRRQSISHVSTLMASVQPLGRGYDTETPPSF